MNDLSLHKTLHFIGIGGAGMSPIAHVALQKGYKVSGSDLKESIHTIRLKDLGAEIFFGQKSANLRKADVVIVSSAISEDNPELMYAKQEKIPLLKRAEMLDLLMAHDSKKICVAGTHGKTTTSSMITKMIDACGKTPTFIIGAELKDFGRSATLGSGDYFVAEADESDGSFLSLHPNIGVITNIEADHLDYYKEFHNIQDHFQRFMEGVISRNGYLVLNHDDPTLKMLGESFAQTHYFSIETAASVMAKNIIQEPEGTRFTLFIDGADHGDVYLQVYGKHNVYNALAAITVGIAEKLPLDCIKKGLFGFSGTKRRFQLIGKVQDIQIYDDYAHHPTEIKVTLEGAKLSLKQRLICIFQPHRYTRTRDLLETFPDAFGHADEIFITEVYSANEKKISHISGKNIVDKMIEKHAASAHFIPKKSDIASAVLKILKPGDVVVTMGAGDIHTVAKELLSQLKKVSGDPHPH